MICFPDFNPNKSNFTSEYFFQLKDFLQSSRNQTLFDRNIYQPDSQTISRKYSSKIAFRSSIASCLNVILAIFQFFSRF